MTAAVEARVDQGIIGTLSRPGRRKDLLRSSVYFSHRPTSRVLELSILLLGIIIMASKDSYFSHLSNHCVNGQFDDPPEEEDPPFMNEPERLVSGDICKGKRSYKRMGMVDSMHAPPNTLEAV